MDEIDQLKEKRNFIKETFRSGFPARYNSHVSTIIKAIDSFIEIYEKVKNVELDEDSKKLLKEKTKLIFTLTEIFENKLKNKEDEVGKIIEAVGLEFYRNADSPEVTGSMVVVHNELKSSAGVCIPISLYMNESGKIKIKDIERLPLILIKPETAFDCNKWLISLHEFAHILVEDYKKLLSSMPTVLDSHSNEFFSDLLATDISGIGFLLAVCKTFEKSDADKETETHPSPYYRVRAIYERLKSEKGSEKELNDICNEVYKKWNDGLSKTTRAVESSSFISTKKLLEDFHKKKKVEFFVEKKWKNVKKILGKEDVSITPITLLCVFSLDSFLHEKPQIIDEKSLRKDIINWLNREL